MKPVKKYLSVHSVSERYEVSKATIWRWVQAQQFPLPVKLNGSTRWLIDDLLSWEQK